MLFSSVTVFAEEYDSKYPSENVNIAKTRAEMFLNSVGKPALLEEGILLKNLNGEYEAVSFSMPENGYIIVNIKDLTIPELSFENSNPYDNVKNPIYNGVLSYYSKVGEEFVSLKDNSSVRIEQFENVYSKEEIADKEESIRTLENTLKNQLRHVNIERYINGSLKTWYISGGHCGSIASAICMRYYYDYVSTNYVPSGSKNIYTCNTLNGDSYINKCSKENNQVVSEKIEGVYVSKLLCSKDMLFAFATTKYGKEMNSYIYIYDAEELSFDEKIDITNYGGTHYKAILFDNNILFSNSVDSGDHPCNTVCIYSINDKTIETISFDQYYPLDLAVWDNILIVSHFDLVKREGGSISIYNLETKELNNIELGHDVEQMTINENVIYILSDKIIYQYELKDMNLYLKCKTQIKKSNEENYLSGIFYIKPESMKFTL